MTLDATALSHGLLPLVAGARVLTEDRPHELVLAPSDNYGFVPASGVVADFRFDLTPDGQLTIEPKYAAFAHAGPERTLVLDGYEVILDARDLAGNLVPSLLSQIRTLPGGREHTLQMLPASRYTLLLAGAPAVAYRFDLTVDGRLHILDAPGGVIPQRPLPPPGSLRSWYAGLFMPPRGSVRAFTDQKATRSLRQAVRDHRDGLLLGRNLREERLAIIDELFDGATSEEEEDLALRHILDSERADDLIFLVNKLTWDGLNDKLDESDLG